MHDSSLPEGQSNRVLAQNFTRVAIANRGEIACRIIESLQKLGLSSILLCAPADHNSRAAQMADAVALLPSNELSESYLNPEALITAALNFHAQAIHPGYGFLSENAAFAQAVQTAGLAWIGPSPDAIALMGDKKKAKAFAAEAGVPGVPGTLLENTDAPSKTVLDKIESIGFPVLIKAAFGGGGRGMRKVYTLADLPEQIQQASREAKNAFGDGTVFIEKCIEEGRHIEVQILSDQHGTHIALGERDCSIQRRHQKVVEECPATCLTAETRARIHAAACALAKACDYQGAGTVEFMATDAGDFYFLEMNTRLQVEHPVTEAVFDEDLVAWQIRIAQGEALPDALQQKLPQGHSIEVRWYAEDPTQDFLPQSGTLLSVSGFETKTSNIRWDHQLCPPQTITPYYDPLLAKVIATGADRKSALHTLHNKLSQVQCFGLQTNLNFLRKTLAHKDVQENKCHTQWLEANLADLLIKPLSEATQASLAAAITFFNAHGQSHKHQNGHTLNLPSSNEFSPAWLGTYGCYAISIKNQHFIADIKKQPSNDTQTSPHLCDNPKWMLSVSLKEKAKDVSHALTIHIQAYNATTCLIEYQAPDSKMPNQHVINFLKTDESLFFDDQHHHYRANYSDFSESPVDTATSDDLRAPCQAIVKALMVSPGDTITAGQDLIAIEAMKIEQMLCSPRDGTVASVSVKSGNAVTEGQILLTLARDDTPTAQEDDAIASAS